MKTYVCPLCGMSSCNGQSVDKTAKELVNEAYDYCIKDPNNNASGKELRDQIIKRLGEECE